MKQHWRIIFEWIGRYKRQNYTTKSVFEVPDDLERDVDSPAILGMPSPFIRIQKISYTQEDNTGEYVVEFGKRATDGTDDFMYPILGNYYADHKPFNSFAELKAFAEAEIQSLMEDKRSSDDIGPNVPSDFWEAIHELWLDVSKWLSKKNELPPLRQNRN